MRSKGDETVLLICRCSLAVIWIYQGLVPKLLGPHRDELAMDLALGVSVEAARRIALIAGVIEVAIGVAVLLVSRHAWPLWLTLVSMVGLLGYAAIAAPSLLIGAFNPVTINIATAALALIALIEQRRRAKAG